MNQSILMESDYYPTNVENQLAEPGAFEKAVSLSQRNAIVIIATADVQSIPHVAAATEGFEICGPRTVSISEWFCPGTVRNLRQNEHVSLTIWDPDTDSGYQLIGRLVNFKNAGIFNGTTPRLGKQSARPKIGKQMMVRIETITRFSAAPHSDAQEY